MVYVDHYLAQVLLSKDESTHRKKSNKKGESAKQDLFEGVSHHRRKLVLHFIIHGGGICDISQCPTRTEIMAAVTLTHI